MILTVPACNEQVGCTIPEIAGIAGVNSSSLMTKSDEATQLGSVAVFRTLILYVVLAAKPLKEIVFTQFVPSMLYSSVPPIGLVTVIVPVDNAQLGWINAAVGIPGGVQTKVIVTEAGFEIFPSLSFTV